MALSRATVNISKQQSPPLKRKDVRRTSKYANGLSSLVRNTSNPLYYGPVAVPRYHYRLSVRPATSRDGSSMTA